METELGIGAAQNIIAIIADFDFTLSKEASQEPIFRKYGINGDEFWKLTDRLSGEYRQKLDDESLFPEELRAPQNLQRAPVCNILAYMDLFLEYIKNGKCKGLSRLKLREFGREIQLCPGVPDFIIEMKNNVKNNPEWNKYGVSLEFYVISSSLEDLIIGSIGKYCDGIFACRVSPDIGDDPVKGEICKIKYNLENTTKTRFVYQVHKGQDIPLDTKIQAHLKRIPGKNILYIGDGPSDVPAMATLIDKKGETIGVYVEKDLPIEQDLYFRNALLLLQQKRVPFIGPANYTKGTSTRKYIEYFIMETANKIIEEKEKLLKGTNFELPKHP
ncbi:hypothetical protein HZB88_02030 [archaeon]|nr:hypothetical protein [archaeon]